MNAEVFRFPCPHCAKSIKVPVGSTATRGRCPGCNGEVLIPKADPVPPRTLSSFADDDELRHPSAPAPPPEPSRLVACEDCGKQISRYASACPNCGRPMAAAAIFNAAPGVQTVELTSKRWKGLQLAGMAIAALGGTAIMFGVFARDTIPDLLKEDDARFIAVGGACLALLGVCVWLYARGQAWWHHG